MTDNRLESAVWRPFNKAWPYRAQRHEPGLRAGLPDVLIWDRDGRRGFVELKRPDAIELNPNQWIWHDEDQQSGGFCPIVTCMNQRGTIWWKVLKASPSIRRILPYHKEPLVTRDRMILLVAQMQRLAV